MYVTCMLFYVIQIVINAQYFLHMCWHHTDHRGFCVILCIAYIAICTRTCSQAHLDDSHFDLNVLPAVRSSGSAFRGCWIVAC